ncbi:MULTISPECIES: DUF4097 family beta strand repeat-containing protein [unclassified Oceanobacillus]|uniref:DUF4097 family beta strand repeat-containing protein n=1 Tax=unclassified Oceanobacillus TaxID=2630292 RepID=UPI00300E2FC2
MKKAIILMGSFLILIVSACSSNTEGNEEKINLEEIEKIFIKNGSQKLSLISTNSNELKVSSGKKDVEISTNGSEITLKPKQQLVQIGPRFNQHSELIVEIPSEYNGQVIVDGSSGDVTAEGLELVDLIVNSKSGSIKLDFTKIDSNIEVDTVSGNVEVILNNNQSNINLKAQTTSGNQVIAIALDEIINQSNKNFEGRSGDGSLSVNILTVSGNITIK